MIDKIDHDRYLTDGKNQYRKHLDSYVINNSFYINDTNMLNGTWVELTDRNASCFSDRPFLYPSMITGVSYDIDVINTCKSIRNDIEFIHDEFSSFAYNSKKAYHVIVFDGYRSNQSKPTTNDIQSSLHLINYSLDMYSQVFFNYVYDINSTDRNKNNHDYDFINSEINKFNKKFKKQLNNVSFNPNDIDTVFNYKSNVKGHEMRSIIITFVK